MKTVAERVNRFREVADLKSDVNRLMTVEVASMMPVKPPLHYECARERIDWAYGRYEVQCENVEKLQDDTVPRLIMLTGTEIFAEAFGCPVQYPSNNNPFALPLVYSAEEAAKVRVPRLEDTRLPILFDMADRLWEKAGKGTLFSLPDLQTPMDIAALIWEKSDFFASMLTEPEAVKELGLKVRELLTAFLDEWFRRYGKAHWAHFPDYYMENGVTISEDEIGSVSPAAFREFFAPELDYLSDRYGGIGIHSCANARHQWQNLARVKGLRFINVCQPKEMTKLSVDYFKNVCAQVPGDWDLGPMPKEAHIVKNVWARDLDDAKRKLDEYAEL